MSLEGEVKKLKEENTKFKEFNELLLMWLQDYQDGRRVVDFFRKNDYKSVAIYGFGDLGATLASELEGTDVEVEYVIDRAADFVYTELKVFRPEDSLPDVDVVVVTAIHYFDDIKSYMEKRISCPIVSMETVISGV
jgi:lactate dehydrogenase-like 2-hydroxyacid dehydrogenase